MRLEELAVDIRRARGRDVTCYAYGAPTDAIEDWNYACRLVVGEFGAISAPAIPTDPADFPQPGTNDDMTNGDN